MGGIQGGITSVRGSGWDAYLTFATYTRDAIAMASNTITTREWLSYGYIRTSIDICGMYCLAGNSGWLGAADYSIAT